LREYYRYHHGGLERFIAMSLETIGNSPDQRATIEAIRTDLRERMKPVRAAEDDLMVTLADGVASGAPATAPIDAAIARVHEAASQKDPLIDASLNRLHDVLTPAQRDALAGKVEAQWDVWRKENLEAGAQAATGERGHLGALGAELGLTQDQVDRTKAALTDNMKDVPRVDAVAVGSAINAFAEAFRRDAFDAKTLPTPAPAGAALVDWGVVHLAHVVEALGPVLTVEQRGILERKLRMHAAHASSAEGSS
jgi:Spy/CpxP family protein refolding chaperone